MKRLPIILILLAILLGLAACGNDDDRSAAKTPASGDAVSDTDAVKEPGSIVFTANGEDFVRRGFVDKQGWSISFENLHVNIVEPTAYISDGDGAVVLEGSHWVDLAEGNAEAEPIVMGGVQEVPPANYQALRFALRRTAGGPYAGSSIVMIGSAKRQGVTVPFTIRLDEEMVFDGPDGYVGEELKGLLQPGSTTEVEMTFHFDHVFGDIEADAADHINTGSVGFDFFYAFAEGGVVDVCQEDLQGAELYGTLVRALWTLGHLGEGHCDVSQQSSKDIL
jgi:hypothetical protein